jgi:hypothetical protein
MVFSFLSFRICHRPESLLPPSPAAHGPSKKAFAADNTAQTLSQSLQNAASTPILSPSYED